VKLAAPIRPHSGVRGFLVFPSAGRGFGYPLQHFAPKRAEASSRAINEIGKSIRIPEPGPLGETFFEASDLAMV
jgi:hypothetical protein